MQFFARSSNKLSTKRLKTRRFVPMDQAENPSAENMRVIHKQIFPNAIMEWQSAQVGAQFGSKGVFKVRDNQTGELIFTYEIINKNKDDVCQVSLMKIARYLDLGVDSKVKIIHKFQGSAKNMKKQGKGIYTIEEFYSNGSLKKKEYKGVWENDVFLEGTYTDFENKQKKIKHSKNQEWIKSQRQVSNNLLSLPSNNHASSNNSIFLIPMEKYQKQ